MATAWNRATVFFTNIQSVDRIIFAIFSALNENYQWENRALHRFTQRA
jgi:hypothetical protein